MIFTVLFYVSLTFIHSFRFVILGDKSHFKAQLLTTRLFIYTVLLNKINQRALEHQGTTQGTHTRTSARLQISPFTASIISG